MSAKSSRPGKVKLPPATPRQIEEIGKSYQEACNQAGQTQYQIYVHKQELERLNKVILSLNQEAAARNELNKKAEASSGS